MSTDVTIGPEGLRRLERRRAVGLVVLGVSLIGMFLFFAFLVGIGHGPSEQTEAWSARWLPRDSVNVLLLLAFSGVIGGGALARELKGFSAS